MIDYAPDKYRRIQVQTANPAQLVVMMYEGIAKFLLQAAVAIEQSDVKASDHYCERAGALVQELLGSLDHEAGGEIARNLAAIYTMTIREMLNARLHRDPTVLQKLSALYLDLKQGWAEIARNASQAHSAT